MESRFFSEIEKEYAELLNTGRIELIETIKQKTTRHFLYKYPIYFIGDISSKFVLISFNSNNNFLPEGKLIKDFSAYISKYQNLGKLYYENYFDRLPKERFLSDIREYSFIKPFQAIKFEKGPLQGNLQKLIDEKLHLELIPFASPDFSINDFISNYITCKPFVERLLAGIFSYPRMYVIFTSNVFFKILSEFIGDADRFIFEVKGDKSGKKQTVIFTRVTIEFNGQKLIAGIADSFGDKNLDESMLQQYGEEAANIINRGIILSSTNWNRQSN